MTTSNLPSSLKIKIDMSEFGGLMENITPAIKQAMSSSLKSASYQFNQEIKQYASSWGSGAWEEVRSITPFLRRKRMHWGKLVSILSRYHVATRPTGELYSQIGVVEPNTPGLKFKPVSKAFVVYAKKHAIGYEKKITKQAQQAMAKILRKKGMKDFIGQILPRVGIHTVERRDFISDLYNRHSYNLIHNVKMKFAEKLMAQMRSPMKVMPSGGFHRRWRQWGSW